MRCERPETQDGTNIVRMLVADNGLGRAFLIKFSQNRAAGALVPCRASVRFHGAPALLPRSVALSRCRVSGASRLLNNLDVGADVMLMVGYRVLFYCRLSFVFSNSTRLTRPTRPPSLPAWQHRPWHRRASGASSTAYTGPSWQRQPRSATGTWCPGRPACRWCPCPAG